MKRVIEIKKGKLHIARHLNQGYQALLALDAQGRHEFKVSGVTAILTEKFGLNKGTTIYIGLKKAGIIRSLGRDKQNGHQKVFRVIRKPTCKLRVDYRQNTKRKPETKKRTCARRQSSPIIEGKDAIRLNVKANQRMIQKELPDHLVRELLKNSGKPLDPMPAKVVVHFFYDE